MSSEVAPPAPAKSKDALLIARIWAAFIAVCHLGGLAGAVAPLFFHTTYSSGSDLAAIFASLAHHIVALITATLLLIGLRSARFALVFTIALSAAHSVSLMSASPILAVVAFGFGLFLYVPPLVLIYWRPEDFC
jgi:hypothetical protein